MLNPNQFLAEGESSRQGKEKGALRKCENVAQRSQGSENSQMFQAYQSKIYPDLTFIFLASFMIFLSTVWVVAVWVIACYNLNSCTLILSEKTFFFLLFLYCLYSVCKYNTMLENSWVHLLKYCTWVKFYSISTLVEYFHWLLFHTSASLHFRGKHCTFTPLTVLHHLSDNCSY